MKKIKRFKNISHLKKYFKRQEKKGTYFSSQNANTEEILKKIGITMIGMTVGAGIGAGIGFYFAGPLGALIGGITGGLIGVGIVNGVYYMVIITRHRDGTFTAEFRPSTACP